MSHTEIRNLRVLLVVEQFNTEVSGGMLARYLARTLRQAGAFVCVYCMSDWRWDTIESFERAQLSLTLAPPSRRLRHIVSGAEVARFKSLLSEFKPDVVDFCSLEYAKSRFLIQAASQNHIRLVARPWLYSIFCRQNYAFLNGKECSLCASGKFYHALSHGCGGGSALGCLLQSFSRSLLRRDVLQVDCFLSSSQAMDRVLTAYGVDPGRIIRGIIPFDPQRMTVFTPKDGDEFVFYGQFKDFKGAHLLPNIIRACPTARFSIRPTGVTEAEIQRIQIDLDQMQNASIVLGLSWFDWLAEHVASSRAVLIPSLYSMSPEYVLLEALGLGKPIIAFNIGVHRDILVHRQNAMVVPLGDTNAFAEAIKELDCNPILRRKLQEGARQTFETLTNSEALLSNTTKAYVGA